MKIWKAELYLIDRDFGRGANYEIIFDFELQEDDYKLNDNLDTYIHWEKWTSTRIPVNMECQSTVGGIKIIQGFAEDKTEKEQEKIKQDMINYMKEYLIKEKNEIVEDYDNKINALI